MFGWELPTVMVLVDSRPIGKAPAEGSGNFNGFTKAYAFGAYKLWAIHILKLPTFLPPL